MLIYSHYVTDDKYLSTGSSIIPITAVPLNSNVCRIMKVIFDADFRICYNSIKVLAHVCDSIGGQQI